MKDKSDFFFMDSCPPQVHPDRPLPPHLGHGLHQRTGHPDGDGRDPDLPGHVPSAQHPLQPVSAGHSPAITPQPTLFIRGSHAFNVANMSGNIYFSL